MALTAILNDLSLEELFALLDSGKRTGGLKVSGGGRECFLELAGGQFAVEAASSGDAIVATATDLINVLETGVERAEFTPVAGGPAGADEGSAANGRVKISPVRVLERVQAIAAEWERIRAVIPSMETTIALSKRPIAGGEPMTLTSEEWGAVFALAQPRVVREVCAELERGPLEGCRILMSMIGKGLVEVTAVPLAGTPEAEEDAPAELIVRGVEDVLAEVTAEMTGVPKRRVRRNMAAGTLADEGGLPAEWQAYMTRLDERASSGKE